MPLRLVLCSLVLHLVVASTPATLVGQRPSVVAFEDFFKWVRSVELAQTEEVVVVSPDVSNDPLGGWIVADSREGQVRLYAKDGSLKGYFGRRGEGPGEFRSIVGVLRTSTGILVTIDKDGRFTAWSTDGSSRLWDFKVPLYPITDMVSVGRDSVLVITTPRVGPQGMGPILHLVDVAARELVRSFYEPAIPPGAAATAWVTILGGGIARSGDQIGVTMPLLDTLIIFSGSLETVEAKIPLGVVKDVKIPDGRADRRGFADWLRSTPLIGPVHATDHGWFIPLIRAGQDGMIDLLFYPNAGGPPMLIRGAPALPGIDHATGEFIFSDPDRLEPQYLRIARVRWGEQ